MAMLPAGSGTTSTALRGSRAPYVRPRETLPHASQPAEIAHGALSASSAALAGFVAASCSTKHSRRQRPGTQLCATDSTVELSSKSGTVTVAAPSIDRAPVAAPATSAPSWREEYWFPVASTLELDPDRPTPVRIDGLDLVVWKNPRTEGREEGWQVFADMCPHRLAPLSEGRIEKSTGCLQCAYHGWEFETNGSCQRIPQVEEGAAKKMRANPRAQAVAFPSEVGLGLVWVWLGKSEPKGLPEDIVNFENTHLGPQVVVSSYTRDLPYTYDGLIENLMDVSHIPFAHHGLQGTRDDAVPVWMSVPKVHDTPDEDGNLITFEFKDRTMKKNRGASFALRSPFFFYYDGEFEQEQDKEGEGGTVTSTTSQQASAGRRFRLNVACVPVDPGRSRAFILNLRGANDKPTFFEGLPRWIGHVFSNRFLDSDLAFLHYQDRNLRYGPRSVEKWNSGYYMPGSSDRSIGAWRQWLTSQGARCVQADTEASQVPPSPPKRSELLDRFTQHTQHCVHCREALAGIEMWTQVMIVAGLISLVLDRSGAPLTPLWVLIEVLAVVAIVAMQWLKQQFYFVDYEHYKS
mmetsp:Transcript_57782/g.129590  ORF Transcript_57782/g.129590 Transcript_57782/m.129590 type:complete len:576 (-) Transcript_57782:86-1813(-)